MSTTITAGRTSDRDNFHVIAELEGHKSEVKGLAWNDTGSKLASCSWDKTPWGAGTVAAVAVAASLLVMRALTDEAIADYVARDAPLDCAGSYRVESLGIALFERVRGDDFTAVIGLPLTRVVALLERFGVRVLG